MTIKINKDKYNALRWAVSYVTTDKHVDLYENGLTFGDESLNWSVNWSALGDTAPAEAMKFADDVKAVAHLGEVLNTMELKLVWEDDENLHTLMNSDPDRAKKGWANYKQLLIDELKRLMDSDKPSVGLKLESVLTAEIPSK